MITGHVRTGREFGNESPKPDMSADMENQDLGIQIVKHLKEYGIRHFRSREAYEWAVREKLGPHFSKYEKMRSSFSGTPTATRKMVDFLSSPEIFGPVASWQAEEMAQTLLRISILIERPSRVLDLGCGLGHFTTWFAQFLGPTCEVFGVDFSSRAITEARRMQKALGLENAAFVNADITKRLPHEKFNVALDIATIHEVSDSQKAIQNIAKAISDDGYLFSVLQDAGSDDVADYAALLQEEGLIVEGMEFIFASDVGEVYRRPMLISRKGSGLRSNPAEMYQSISDHVEPETMTSLWESVDNPERVGIQTR